MFSFIRAARLVVLPAAFFVVGAVGHAQAPAAGVSLKVSREVAPPGAIAQMKVFVTEPKPITTGFASMDFDAFGDVAGIALASGAAGIAVVDGSQIALSVLSPTAAFGMDSDYPVLTVAGRVRASAPPGARVPMTIDPVALQLTDPAGNLYPADVKDGYLESGGSLSISDVVPGSADVAAGGVVSILGTGFRPDTRVRLKETLLADVRYVSPTRIDVMLAVPATMHGRAIRVRNRDGSEATYFSYQRTRRAGATADPVLQNVVPIFPGPASATQTIDVSETTTGLALQNLEGIDAVAVVEFVDANGLPRATGQVVIPSNTYVVRSMFEIIGWSPGTPGVVTVIGVSPLQLLGVDVHAGGRVTPRLPR